jgi:two-component system, chemotaxis family, chemotaxis protein CheY
MRHRHCFPFVVVEDDGFALMLQRALLEAGVPKGNVHRFRDGESALHTLRTIDVVQPSLVFLDLRLPGMSGLALMERLRSWERLEQLPTFVLSDQADPKHVASAYALRAGGYWLKPGSDNELLEIVEGILGSLGSPGRIPLPRCLPDPRFTK